MWEVKLKSETDRVSLETRKQIFRDWFEEYEINTVGNGIHLFIISVAGLTFECPIHDWPTEHMFSQVALLINSGAVPKRKYRFYTDDYKRGPKR